PHHAPAAPPPGHEGEARIDAAVAVALVHVLQARDILARTRRRLEFECHGLAPPRRLDALDLLQLLDPALHLCGMGSARLEALDELDLLGQHRLLPLELRLLLLVVERPLLLIELVIAGKSRELTGIDL